LTFNASEVIKTDKVTNSDISIQQSKNSEKMVEERRYKCYVCIRPREDSRFMELGMKGKPHEG
jgi:hypothetical protein